MKVRKLPYKHLGRGCKLGSPFAGCFFVLVLASLFFASCDNFINGSLLKDEIQKQIEYSKAQEINILISPESSVHGTTYPNGNITKKVTDTFSVSFKPADGYQFIKWAVVNYKTGEAVTDVIKIESPDSLETKIEVLDKADFIQVYPVVFQNLGVDTFKPEDSEDGVPKDSSIVITLSEDLSTENDLSKIKITSGGNSVSHNYKDPVLNGNSIIIAADLTKLIEFNSEKTKIVSVSIPDDFYYEKDDVQVKIGSTLIYDFRINNTTLETAEITCSVAGSKGSVIPSGTNNYSLGEEIDLKFEKNEDYRFYYWNILDSDGNEISEDDIKVDNIFALETKIKILSAIKGVNINPKCELIPKVNTIIPEYTNKGVEQDSDIIITFNTPVKAEDFNNTFKNIQITSDGNDLLSSDNCYFQLPVLSEDGTQLKIRTVKTKRILPSDSTANYQNVVVKLNLEKLTDVNNISFESDFSYEYKVNKNVDSVIPELKEFKVFKTKNADGTYSDELSLSDIENWTENQFKQNHLKDKIYVYIKARDEGDGIYRARIKEEQLYYSMGEASNYKTDYKIVNSDFRELDDYCYETYFEYTLTPTYDGIEKVDISFFDYAEHPVNLQSFYVIKDTENSTVRWTVNNYNKSKPLDAGDDRSSTRIYWSNIDDIYATYKGVTYKTSIEDMKVSFAYGNNKNSLHKKDLSSSDVQFESRKVNQEDVTFGSYSIDYEDITKETYIELTVTDKAGNAGAKLYAIPPMREFCSSYYKKQESNNSPWYYYITDPVNPELENVTVRYVSYDAGENSIINTSSSEPVVVDGNSAKHTQYLQVRYEFNDNGNKSTFYAPWGTAYNHISFSSSQAPKVPVFTGKIDNTKPLIGSRFCSRISIPVASYHTDYKYLIVSGGSSGTQDVHQLMDFVQEDNEMVYYVYSEGRTFNIYVMDGTKCSEPVEVKCSGETGLASDREGPEFGYDDLYYSASGGFLFDYCADESGFKPYEKDNRYTKVEYFYIPYLPIYKYSPLNLTEAQMDAYKKTVMLSPITEESEWLYGGDAVYQFDFEPKDLEPGQVYSLYVKAYDSENNCTYGPMDYTLCLWPLKEKSSYVYDETGNTLTVSIKQELNTKYYNVIWEEFDDTNQGWKQNRRVDNPDNPVNHERTSDVTMNGPVDDLYNVSINVPSDKFIRYCVKAFNEPFFQSLQLQGSNTVHTTTATSYLYTSPVKCNVKNIMTGVAGTTVFCDQPCLYYICTSDVGYGRDVEKWERYGARIGYTQVSSSSNVDDSLVQPGDKYVVIAHFADNTTLMSEVMEK